MSASRYAVSAALGGVLTAVVGYESLAGYSNLEYLPTVRVRLEDKLSQVAATLP